MSCEGEGEGEEEEGKLPSVDHGRRTDRGRDKNGEVSCLIGRVESCWAVNEVFMDLYFLRSYLSKSSEYTF
jgi:hypothetical protein